MTGQLEEKCGLDNFNCSKAGHVVNIYVPMELEGMAPLCDVSCGWSHTVGITSESHERCFNCKFSVCVCVCVRSGQEGVDLG